MIIDAHAFESLNVFPKIWMEGFYRMKKATLGEEVAEKLISTLDGSIETLIKDMDGAGVDKCIVSHLDYSIMYQQEPDISVWKANEYMAEEQGKYPERFYN